MDTIRNIFTSNGLSDYGVAILIFAVSVGILKIFKAIIISRLEKLSKKTSTELDDMVVKAIDHIHWPFYVFVSAYISLQFIVIPEFLSKGSFYIFFISILYYSVRFAEDLIEYGFRKIIDKRQEKEENTNIIRLLQIFTKVTLWVGAVVLFLSNAGYNVTSLVAGLGVGGIAIALALQNILGDLFSSFSIYLDKPFEVGDYISLGSDKMGTVTKIGIKTTRIKSVQGEELVVANGELTKAQISNFGRISERRVSFEFGVTYETSSDKLKKIPGFLKEIVEAQNSTKFDRAHLMTFGDSSLNYSVVYHVASGSYLEYADIQQAINLSLIERFEKEGIEFAYPTQTLYVKK